MSKFRRKLKFSIFHKNKFDILAFLLLVIKIFY